MYRKKWQQLNNTLQLFPLSPSGLVTLLSIRNDSRVMIIVLLGLIRKEMVPGFISH